MQMVVHVNDDNSSGDDAVDFDETETIIGGLLHEDGYDDTKDWLLLTGIVNKRKS